MKNTKIILLLAVGLLSLSSCGGSNDPAIEPSESAASSKVEESSSKGGEVFTSISEQKPTYTITFDSQGGTPVAPITVTWGEMAAAPKDPTREGFIFDGWFKDTYAVTPFLFGDNYIYADWTLYAGWREGSAISSNEESSEQSEESSQSSSQEEDGYIYFKDASWWAKDGAATSIYGWGGSKAYVWPGELMESLGKGIWRYALEEIKATSIIFARHSPNASSTGSSADWGAKTIDLTLSERGTHNMYDISNSSTLWGEPGVSGVWTDYVA